jgi:hypothetical protein
MASPIIRPASLAAILILFGVTEGVADDLPGRYQAMSLTKPNDTGGTVLIIDTKTGDIWKWFEGTSGNGQGGSGIRYEGAVVPGVSPGEIVARQGFSLPMIHRQPSAK